MLRPLEDGFCSVGVSVKRLLRTRRLFIAQIVELRLKRCSFIGWCCLDFGMNSRINPLDLVEVGSRPIKLGFDRNKIQHSVILAAKLVHSHLSGATA